MPPFPRTYNTKHLPRITQLDSDFMQPSEWIFCIQGLEINMRTKTMFLRTELMSIGVDEPLESHTNKSFKNMVLVSKVNTIF